MSGAQVSDQEAREAIESVRLALAHLNDALRLAMGLSLRVEFGTVEKSGGYGDQNVARGWSQLWTKDGLAVRVTREELLVAPAPTPPVQDAEPGIPGPERGGAS